MNKFEKLEELMKSEALSAHEVVTHCVKTGKLSVATVQRMYFCFPISKALLADVKPGMFWYKDDMVSEELIPGKEIKSVVLLVDYTNNKIYGDAFFSVSNTWGAVKMYLEHHQEVTLFDRYHFSQMLVYIEAINRARQQLSRTPLADGYYWTPDPDVEHALLAGYGEGNKRVWGCDLKGSSKPLLAKESHIMFGVKEYDVIY